MLGFHPEDEVSITFTRSRNITIWGNGILFGSDPKVVGSNPAIVAKEYYGVGELADPLAFEAGFLLDRNQPP